MKSLAQGPVYGKHSVAAAAAAKSLQACPTLCDPIDGQPTRLSRPWDSPGKNAGVGCHFLLQCMNVKSESEVAQSCPTLSKPMDCSLPGLCPWDFPGKSTGVGCHYSVAINLSIHKTHAILQTFYKDAYCITV